jgi:hypothetical protein
MSSKETVTVSEGIQNTGTYQLIGAFRYVSEHLKDQLCALGRHAFDALVDCHLAKFVIRFCTQIA